MTTAEQAPKKSMREMMPPNYLPTLVKRTGLSTPTIFRVVKNEHTRSAAWPEVVKLAKEYQKQLQEEEALRSAS